MEKITLVNIKDTERTSAKTGKPFTSRSVKTREYGDKWISGFAGKDNQDWREGDVVEVEITKKPDGKGGEYVNFAVPKAQPKATMSQDDIQKLLTAINAVNTNVLRVLSMLQNAGKESNVKYPTESFDPAEIDEAFARGGI